MGKIIAYLFGLDAILEIYAEITGEEMLKVITKPLLMPLLIFYYASSIEGPVSRFHKLMIAAFFFSWWGDMFLMLVPKRPSDLMLLGIPKDPVFFLAGLVSFLITHVLYIFSFADVRHKHAHAILPKKWWVLVPLAVYLAILLYALVPAIAHNPEPAIQGFLIPVLVYTSVISLMVVFAINRYRRVNDASFALVLAGALSFMVSDSLIALSRFVTHIELAGTMIMFLYILGQFLIAKGSLRQFHLHHTDH